MALSRPLYMCSGTSPVRWMLAGNPRDAVQTTRLLPVSVSRIHVTQHTPVLANISSHYSPAVPENMVELNSADRFKFSPRRARDVSTPLLLLRMRDDLPRRAVTSTAPVSDLHVVAYDQSFTVNLSSSMQTTVPQPPATNSGSSSAGRGSYLNMPGGQWAQDDKYLSHDLQLAHPRAQGFASGLFPLLADISAHRGLHTSASASDDHQGLADSSPAQPTGPSPKLSQRERLKLAVRDYGATVVVFHVSLALTSLGCFYLCVQSGLDVVGGLRWLGLADSVVSSSVVTGGSTFVVAYAVHKVFAPVRIAITLTCTPLIVRYLRRKGVLSARSRTS